MTFINHRDYASKGLMHPSMAKQLGSPGKYSEVDFYKPGTGDKTSGRVHKNDGKEVHMHEFLDGSTAKTRLHKFKVQEHLPESDNSMTNETEQLTEEDFEYIMENMTIAQYVELDELSKDTLKSYVKKAHTSSAQAWHNIGTGKYQKKDVSTAVNRMQGTNRAVDKLAK